MSSTNFTIKTHAFPGQHIRHYPGTTRDGHEYTPILLAAKQYIPISNQSPKDDDATFLLAGATAFPKELYEPVFDHLLSTPGLRIRSIWTIDKAEYAASSILNEEILGDDPSHLDWARDILCLTNIFRSDFLQPIIGLAHSMGSTSLLELHRMHPRLLASIILIDPTIGETAWRVGMEIVHYSTARKDLWSSRAEAENFFRSSRALKSWHPRVMDLWLQYGIRDTPTKLYPEPGKVTLTTTKANELFSCVRTWFDNSPTSEHALTERERIKYPDAVGMPSLNDHLPFYKPEIPYAFADLPRVRCPILYIFPSKSPMYTPAAVSGMLAATGTGLGGNGGEGGGWVDKVVLEGAGHLAPFEDPERCARVVGEYVVKEVGKWVERREWEREHRDGKSVDGVKLSQEWVRREKPWYEEYVRREREVREKQKGKGKL